VQRDAATAEAVDAQRRRTDAEQSAASLAARLAQSTRPAAAADPASSNRGAQAAVFALTMTRAAGAGNDAHVNRIRVAGEKWIVLMVDLARPASSARFVATLSDAESHAAVWSGGPYEAAAPETLTLALDAALFHPGDFVLRLERRLADGRATLEGQYLLRVFAPVSR
jgi:hypothetical protein